MNDGYTRSTLSSPYRSDLSSIWASSQPYCIFRNHSRSVSHEATETFATNLSSSWHKTKTNHFKMMANRQASNFRNLYPESFIPFGLVKDTLESDIAHHYTESQMPSKMNTVVSFTTGSTPYLLHSGGEFMDELVVRNGNFLLPQYCYPTQPSFSINLTKGSLIRQLIAAGREKYGTVANILATTRSEVYYLQAYELQGNNIAINQQLLGTCILEPIGKWILPDEISDVAGPLNASNIFSSYSSSAVFISKSGQIFTWNPFRGVLEHNHLSFPVNNPLIAMSHSPTKFYIANDCITYDYDLRSRQCSGVLYTTDSKISSIQSHVTNSQQYILTTDTSLLLMDRRYSREYLFKQSMPQRYDFLCCRKMLSNRKEPSHHRTVDLVLGANRSSMSNLYLHYCQDRSLHHSKSIPQYPLLSPHLQSALYSRRKYQFSDLFSPVPSHNVPSWRTEAFPVVDTVQRLSGIEILMLSGNSSYKLRGGGNRKMRSQSEDQSSVHTIVSSDHSTQSGTQDSNTSTENSSQNSSEDEEEREEREEKGDRGDASRESCNYCGLIIQQNLRGDVFAQQFNWGDVPFDPRIPIVPKDGDMINSTYHSDSSLTVSSTSTLRPLYTFRDTNAFSQDDDDEEDEEVGTLSRSGKASPARKNRWISSSLATINGDDEDEEDNDESEFGTAVDGRLHSREGSKSYPFSPLKKRPVVSSQASTPSKRSLPKSNAIVATTSPEKVASLARQLPPIIYNGGVGHRFMTTMSTLEASKLLLPLLKKVYISPENHNEILFHIFRYLQQYFQTTTAISLTFAANALPALQLSHHQFHSSDLIIDHCYPYTSAQFLPFLPPEDQLPTLILQFNLLDLRRDGSFSRSRKTFSRKKFSYYPVLSLPSPPLTSLSTNGDPNINDKAGNIYFIEEGEEETEELSDINNNPDDEETRRLLTYLTSFMIQQQKKWFAYFSIEYEKSPSLQISRSLYEIWYYFYQLTKRRLAMPLLRKLLLSLSVYSKGIFIVQESYLPNRMNISQEIQNSFYSDGLYVASSSNNYHHTSERAESEDNYEDDSVINDISKTVEHEEEVPASKRQKLDEKDDRTVGSDSDDLRTLQSSSSSSSSSPSSIQREDDHADAQTEEEKDEASTIVVSSSSSDDETRSKDVTEGSKKSIEERRNQEIPKSQSQFMRQEQVKRKKTPDYFDEANYGCCDCPLPSSQRSIDQCFTQHPCTKRDCLLPHCVVYSLSSPNSSTLSSTTTKTLQTERRRGKPPKVPKPPIVPTETKKHTDVTPDLISLLKERWDQSIAGAMPRWPSHRVVDIYQSTDQ